MADAETLPIPAEGQGLHAGVKLALHLWDGSESERQAELFAEAAERRAAGRPKGALHKATRDMAEFLRSQGMNPLTFLHMVMTGQVPDAKLEHRMDAAKALAPYLYKQQARDVNVAGAAAVTIVIDGRHVAGQGEIVDASAGLGGADAGSNDFNGLAALAALDVNADDVNAHGQAVDPVTVSPSKASNQKLDGRPAGGRP
jgi:hypothetical protein